MHGGAGEGSQAGRLLMLVIAVERWRHQAMPRPGAWRSQSQHETTTKLFIWLLQGKTPFTLLLRSRRSRLSGRLSGSSLQDPQQWLICGCFFFSRALELPWQLLAFPDVQDTPYLQASTVTGHDFGSCESLWDHGDCKPGCTGRVDSAGTGTTFWLHQGGVVHRLCLPGSLSWRITLPGST